jgi:hypothetical protein
MQKKGYPETWIIRFANYRFGFHIQRNVSLHNKTFVKLLLTEKSHLNTKILRYPMVFNTTGSHKNSFAAGGDGSSLLSGKNVRKFLCAAELL